MKNNIFIFIFLLSLGLTSCKTLQEASLTGVEGFKLGKVSMEGVDGEINLKIKNPNHVGFTIYPSEFEIVYSGIKLGKAKLNKRVHIDANAERVYTFKLQSDMDLNFLDLAKILNSDKLGSIEIKGELKAGKFLIKRRYPVNYTDKISLFK